MSTSRKKLLKKLKNKYRLVIMNDQTFEEKFSMKLTPMNLFMGGSSGIIMFTVLIMSLFFFTPLKEYVPGYAGYDNPESIRKANRNNFVIDSLEKALSQQKAYNDNLNDILNGREPNNQVDTAISPIKPSSSLNMNESYGQDSAFRAEMERDETKAETNTPPAEEKPEISHYAFFSPIKGLVTEKFNYNSEHYAVDVVAKPSEPVKATLDGTVIFASWTPETGHVIGLQHNNDLISIYKHNAVILKKVGTFVNAGDAISIAGNSGELTTGPHLHFELWYRGSPVNPEDYMVF